LLKKKNYLDIIVLIRKKTKKKTKKESKRKSRKNLKRELIGNTNNEEDKISDIKKNLERIDNIYKQIVNL
jgi:hypothetical protein